jgi:hypothetical protein
MNKAHFSNPNPEQWGLIKPLIPASIWVDLLLPLLKRLGYCRKTTTLNLREFYLLGHWHKILPFTPFPIPFHWK